MERAFDGKAGKPLLVESRPFDSVHAGGSEGASQDKNVRLSPPNSDILAAFHFTSAHFRPTVKPLDTFSDISAPIVPAVQFLDSRPPATSVCRSVQLIAHLDFVCVAADLVRPQRKSRQN